MIIKSFLNKNNIQVTNQTHEKGYTDSTEIFIEDKKCFITGVDMGGYDVCNIELDYEAIDKIISFLTEFKKKED